MVTADEVLREVEATALNEYNTKIVLIKWIMDKYKYIGIEDKFFEKHGMNYYGMAFDFLYDKNIEQLEKLDQKLQGYASTVSFQPV